MHQGNAQPAQPPKKRQPGPMTADQAAMDFLVHVDGHPTCPCGQELDTWRRAHCPRCGHRVPDERFDVA